MAPLPVSAVSAATTTKAAAVAVVDHLAAGGPMPSVHLEREGRLRCQAVRGYWQIYDGIPPTVRRGGRDGVAFAA